MQKPDALPAILQPGNPLVDESRQRDVLATIDGNPEKLRRDSLIVYGETANEVRDALAAAGYGTERVKIYSKYAIVRPDLPEVLAAVREGGATPYLGGGVAEHALKQPRKLAEVTRTLQGLGLDMIEVSNSGGELNVRDYARIIASLRKDFAHVLAEIGEKKSHGQHATQRWMDEMKAALDTDATDVILEGSGAGTVGIYHGDGRARTLLVALLANVAGDRWKDVIIEAPQYSQQCYWIQGLGWDTRLGNVSVSATSQLSVIDERMDAMRAKDKAEIAEAAKDLRSMAREALPMYRKSGVDIHEAVEHPHVGTFPFRQPQQRADARHNIRTFAEHYEEIKDQEQRARRFGAFFS